VASRPYLETDTKTVNEIPAYKNACYSHGSSPTSQGCLPRSAVTTKSIGSKPCNVMLKRYNDGLESSLKPCPTDLTTWVSTALTVLNPETNGNATKIMHILEAHWSTSTRETAIWDATYNASHYPVTH